MKIFPDYQSNKRHSITGTFIIFSLVLIFGCNDVENRNVFGYDRRK